MAQSAEDLAFMAELDASFGKKAKVAKTDTDARKALNKAFHEQNQPIGKATGKTPEYDLSYNWEGACKGEYQPIEPEARVAYIVHQLCGSCGVMTWYTGQEYVRFRRRRLRYNQLTGHRATQIEKIIARHEVQTESTIMRRLSDCDPNLIAFGLPNGRALPEVIEEHYESVPRCPTCITTAEPVIDLWLDDPKRKDPVQMEMEIAGGIKELVVNFQ